MKKTNLCFLIGKDKILLAMKKRGFGQGKWNGVGGKVQEKETVKDAVIRETEEEIGVNIKKSDLKQVATLKFHFENKTDWDQKCEVYITKKWEGNPKETEEMKPRWFSFTKIPFKKMWVDDIHWLPLVLKNYSKISKNLSSSKQKIEAEFLFSEDGSKIIKQKIN